MPRTRKVPQTPWQGLGRWLLQLALPLAGASLVLGGLVFLGRHALFSLRARAGTVPFADVSCAAPPGTSREEFLGEVQYLGTLPDRLDPFDPTLPERLAGVFALHPWVAKVERVEKGPGRLRVHLRYRVPILAVALKAGPGGEVLRAVDEEGVLLPAKADRSGLPRLEGVLDAPGWLAGRPTQVGRIKACARVAAVLRSHKEELPFERCTMGVEDEDVFLFGRGWRVRWGSPPGQEKPGEASAEEKIRRLATNGVEGRAVDLRRAPQMTR